MKNVTLSYTFSVSDLLASDEMKHTIAKIAYEWQCLHNGIDEYAEEFTSDIVSYILGVLEDDSIVEVVNTDNMYNVIEQMSEYGSHLLFEYINHDGWCYVIYSFWNVMVYKIRIYNTGDSNRNNVARFNVDRYRIDGTKDEIELRMKGKVHIPAMDCNEAIQTMHGTFVERLQKLTTTITLSIFIVKTLIDDLVQDLIKYENSQCEFIQSFFNVDEFLVSTAEERLKYVEELKDEERDNRLSEILRDGINVFVKIWENEKTTGS